MDAMWIDAEHVNRPPTFNYDSGPPSMRVLVADDCVVVRHHVAMMIRATGCVDHVSEADSGAGAIECVRRDNPDVVVLDIQMQNGSGIDALAQIKQEAPGTHVIMLTNHADPVYRSACMRAGAAQFFDKSLEFERVCDFVADLATLRS
jgi:DNA-binding NarL/FixJ family response regulator